jgi:hypothetical protein
MSNEAVNDLLAQLTEDLLADRRTSAVEALTALNEDERKQLLDQLTVARRLKAVYQEEPPASEAFLHRLDTRVRQEIENQLSPDAGHEKEIAATASGVGPFRPPPAHGFAAWGRGVLALLVPSTSTGRWRLAGVAALGVLLALQVQLYFHVRQLESQNQNLVSRLERAAELDRMRALSLGLPHGATDQAQREVPQGRSSAEILLQSVEIQRRIERRIQALQEDVKTKTGMEREKAQTLLRELEDLLRP